MQRDVNRRVTLAVSTKRVFSEEKCIVSIANLRVISKSLHRSKVRDPC